MMFSFKLSPVRAVTLFLAALLVCSCNVPGSVPTATNTPDWTATPTPPANTPTPRPTPTATPIPEYLSIKSEDLEGTRLILRSSLNGMEQKELEELVNLFNTENEEGITVQLIHAASLDELSSITSAQSKDKTDLVIADSA